MLADKEISTESETYWVKSSSISVSGCTCLGFLGLHVVHFCLFLHVVSISARWLSIHLLPSRCPSASGSWGPIGTGRRRNQCRKRDIHIYLSACWINIESETYLFVCLSINIESEKYLVLVSTQNIVSFVGLLCRRPTILRSLRIVATPYRQRNIFCFGEYTVGWLRLVNSLKLQVSFA